MATVYGQNNIRILNDSSSVVLNDTNNVVDASRLRQLRDAEQQHRRCGLWQDHKLEGLDNTVNLFGDDTLTMITSGANTVNAIGSGNYASISSGTVNAGAESTLSVDGTGNTINELLPKTAP